MKHIAILVPKGAILGSVEGPRQVLTEVNKFFKNTGRDPVFDVQLTGLTKEVQVAGGKYTVNTDVLTTDLPKTDLIIIPALDGNMPVTLEQNRDYIPWIVEQYGQGAEVASLCVGAFLLASTGLVTGRKCATHWMAANDFRRMFPEVNLVEDKIITDEYGIYSSGGAFSYLNLILYLVEKYAGRDTAVFMSKAFQIDIERHSQSPFAIFKGQKEHEDEVIKKTQLYIENNYQEKITVEELASMFAVSRRNLERRFKKATSNSIVEYLQRVRIEAAKMCLESSRDSITEVMFKVGYSDSKAFRDIFKRITGLSPLQYSHKYNREMAA
ncbi:helix-turn-helix domain-containing protein [Rhodocytophaga aerolata]|uniref:Helix-turn-helix domain-containing protein n=1 Tax=Rhodocytophaga aerolata TaxID=455078 RepID=A0ABT8RA65_9BACT|nr:helix-turn-helix domain-containing protein [Rhodocytophaga aerolata]MDO1448994.1 helix-turn-helix domain-containing protein [Rhodocytophaga aerolata]